MILKLFRLKALVNEALELTEGRLQERGVSIHIEPNLPNVYGDHQRLLEVVQNLLDNAAKFMGDQPHPIIEIGQHGESKGIFMTFYIRDNGIGIAPQYHERIFGLFNRLDPKIEGTGVGLALVKRIVEFHGGRIWVVSEAGKGGDVLLHVAAGRKPNPKSGWNFQNLPDKRQRLFENFMDIIYPK